MVGLREQMQFEILSQLYISNRDMITRLATRIQLTLPLRSVFTFSKYHDGRGKPPRGQRSPFFGKPKHKEETHHDSQTHNPPKFRDNPFKSKPFTQKDKQATQHHSKEELSRTPKPKTDEQSTSSLKTGSEDKAPNIVQETSEKIPPLQKRELTDTRKDSCQYEESQTNEIEFDLTWCDQLQEDADKLQELFDGQKWRELSELMTTYDVVATQEQIIKYIHPLFVARSLPKYLKWIESTNLSISSLPQRLVKTILLDLIHDGSWLEIKKLIPHINKQSLSLEYSFLDAIFSDVDDKASLKVLKAQIPVKIETALALLEIIDRAKFDSEERFRPNEYLIDSWFAKLWQIVKQRRLCQESFLDLFQTLVCDHHRGISLMPLHSRGVFLDILETYYFGSHATTSKIKQLFEHTYLLPSYDVLLINLRDRMRTYKAKTGVVPFPNAKALFDEMQHQIEKQDYEKAVFYYLLCLYGNQPHPFPIFEHKKQLLDLMIMDDRFENIIYDGLFNLPKESFFQPIPKAAELIEQEQRQIKLAAEEELKQFFKEKANPHKSKRQKGTQKPFQSRYAVDNLDNNVQESDSLEEEDLYLASYTLSTFKNPLDGLDGVPQLKDNRKKARRPVNREEVEEMFAEAEKKSEEDVGEPIEEELSQEDYQQGARAPQEYQNSQKESQDELTQTLKFFNMQPIEQIKELFKISQQLLVNKQEKQPISAHSKLIKDEIDKEIQQRKQARDQDQFDSEVGDENVFESTFEEKNELVQLLQFEHRADLRMQIKNETNFFRKKLLKTLVNPDSIDSVKAAIKLDRPELAFTIFKQKIMKPVIHERTSKNIKFVAQAFLRDHYKHNKDMDIHEIIDSISLDNILNLNDEEDKGELSETETEGYELSTEKEFLQIRYGMKDFLCSIYEKLQNFDFLLWKQMPFGEIKHDFWESTLLLDRAQELIKMDINGKLSQMAYEPEYEELPTNELKRIRENQDWRNELIYRLGIQEGQSQPMDSYNMVENYWVGFQNNEQAHKYLVQPLLNPGEIPEFDGNFTNYGPPDCDPVFVQQVQSNGLQNIFKGRSDSLAQAAQQFFDRNSAIQQYEDQAGEELQYIENQENQPEEDAELLEADHEAQPAQELEEEHEQLEAAQEQEQQEIEQEQQDVQPQAQASQFQGVAESSDQGEQIENIYQHSQRMHVQGYDFNFLVGQVRNIFRPMFEKMYEQQKAFIKHMLALEAIAEQARISDNHSLQKKLNESEEQLTDAGKIAQLITYGLWNYDFVSVEKPQEYIQRADAFREKFFEFKKYMGTKGPGAVPDLSKQHVANFYELITERRLTRDLVEELLMKRYDLFLEAEAVVKLEPRSDVEQMLLWGVLNDEPLGVYMGEKLAMLTNQKIPHNLALLVSRYLSHRREVPEERIRRCKAALKIVGRINREHIYDMSKDYEHITVRKYLNRYINERQKQLEEQSLTYLTKLDARHFDQESGLSKQKLSRAGLTV